jgi:RNA polymerase sigma-70 factor (ECF subfamily)
LADDDDAALLESWRAGDRDAGDELLRRHFLGVLRYFSSHPGVDAEELTQRTFEACIAARDRVRDQFVAYLFGIARNQLLREWERKGYRGEPVSPTGIALRDMRTSPSMKVAKLDEQLLFARGLQTLPREFSSVLELFFWEDRSIQEIADALGIPPGTVKSRLHRGKAMLRAWLDAAPQRDELRTGALAILEARTPPSDA